MKAQAKIFSCTRLFLIQFCLVICVGQQFAFPIHLAALPVAEVPSATPTAPLLAAAVKKTGAACI